MPLAAAADFGSPVRRRPRRLSSQLPSSPVLEVGSLARPPRAARDAARRVPGTAGEGGADGSGRRGAERRRESTAALVVEATQPDPSPPFVNADPIQPPFTSACLAALHRSEEDAVVVISSSVVAASVQPSESRWPTSSELLSHFLKPDPLPTSSPPHPRPHMVLTGSEAVVPFPHNRLMESDTPPSVELITPPSKTLFKCIPPTPPPRPSSPVLELPQKPHVRSLASAEKVKGVALSPLLAHLNAAPSSPFPVLERNAEESDNEEFPLPPPLPVSMSACVSEDKASAVPDSTISPPFSISCAGKDTPLLPMPSMADLKDLSHAAAAAAIMVEESNDVEVPPTATPLRADGGEVEPVVSKGKKRVAAVYDDSQHSRDSTPPAPAPPSKRRLGGGLSRKTAPSSGKSDAATSALLSTKRVAPPATVATQEAKPPRVKRQLSEATMDAVPIARIGLHVRSSPAPQAVQQVPPSIPSSAVVPPLQLPSPSPSLVRDQSTTEPPKSTPLAPARRGPLGFKPPAALKTPRTVAHTVASSPASASIVESGPMATLPFTQDGGKPLLVPSAVSERARASQQVDELVHRSSSLPVPMPSPSPAPSQRLFAAPPSRIGGALPERPVPQSGGAASVTSSLFTKGNGRPVELSKKLLDKAHESLARLEVADISGSVPVPSPVVVATAPPPGTVTSCLFATGNGRPVQIAAQHLESARAALSAPQAVQTMQRTVSSTSTTDQMAALLFSTGSGKQIVVPKVLLDSARLATNAVAAVVESTPEAKAGSVTLTEPPKSPLPPPPPPSHITTSTTAKSRMPTSEEEQRLAAERALKSSLAMSEVAAIMHDLQQAMQSQRPPSWEPSPQLLSKPSVLPTPTESAGMMASSSLFSTGKGVPLPISTAALHKAMQSLEANDIPALSGVASKQTRDFITPAFTRRPTLGATVGAERFRPPEKQGAPTPASVPAVWPSPAETKSDTDVPVIVFSSGLGQVLRPAMSKPAADAVTPVSETPASRPFKPLVLPSANVPTHKAELLSPGLANNNSNISVGGGRPFASPLVNRPAATMPPPPPPSSSARLQRTPAAAQSSSPKNANGTRLSSLQFPFRATPLDLAHAALARGVPKDTVHVTSLNAHLVCFDENGRPKGFDFSAHQNESTLLGVQPAGASLAWTRNHFRFAVWTLASMERVLGKGSLSREAVAGKLQRRWQREQAGQRSVVHSIVARTLPSTVLMVLLVSEITSLEDSSATLRFCDGWYEVEAMCDGIMAKRVRQGNVKVGDKLVVSHALLSGPDCALHPLDLIGGSGGTRLVVASNACIPAKWHAKLGMRREAALKRRLTDVDSAGGVVPLLRCVVLRASPLLRMHERVVSLAEVDGGEEGQPGGLSLLRLELTDESGGRTEVTMWNPEREVAEGTIVRVTSLYPPSDSKRRSLNTCKGSRWYFEPGDPVQALQLGYVPRRHTLLGASDGAGCDGTEHVVDSTLVVVSCNGGGAFLLSRANLLIYLTGRRNLGFQANAVVAVRDLFLGKMDSKSGVLNCTLADSSLITSSHPRRHRLLGHLATNYDALSEWARSMDGKKAVGNARTKALMLQRAPVARELKLSVADVNMTVTGRKSVEARTAHWWAAHEDIRRFTVSDKVVTATLAIESVAQYSSFRQLVEAESWERVCPRAGSVDKAVQALRECNSTAEELEGGVVALRLRVVEERKPSPPPQEQEQEQQQQQQQQE